MLGFTLNQLVHKAAKCPLNESFEVSLRDYARLQIGFKELFDFLYNNEVGWFHIEHIQAPDINDDVVKITRCHEPTKTLH